MTTNSRSTKSWWRPLGVATILLLALAGCSSSIGEISSTSTTATTTSNAATATAAEVGPAEPQTPTAPIDGQKLLANALASFASGYDFIGTVTINSEQATVIAGRWFDGSSQVSIRSGSGEVEYITTADGQWARLPGSEWEELDGLPQSENPLAALSSPTSLEVSSSNTNTVRLSASYPAAELGLVGDPIDVILVIEDGLLVRASYDIEIDGNTGGSVTEFAKLGDTTPIVNPINS